MSIPSYEEFMFPILKLLADDKTYHRKDIYNQMARYFNLSNAQINELLPSQTEPKYQNRISWALTYLQKAGLITRPSRAHFHITNEGKEIVKNNTANLNTKFLNKYESFIEFRNSSYRQDNDIKEKTNIIDTNTPLENIINNFEFLKKNICDELLDKILKQSSDFFEQLVVDLIVAMGYGGSKEETIKATQRTKDEGIDGVIKEDKLGLDSVYLQAKRWQKGNVVGRPEIQKFVGALSGQGARKGIFITTSTFTKEALEYKPRNDSTIILIDGQKLVEYMYEYNVGVNLEQKFEIKRLDNDYFESD